VSATPGRKPLTYAGIGSRETPAEMLNLMTSIAQQLETFGWRLRTGGADGADTAFANGCIPENREIHLPWAGYNGLHPNGQDLIVPRELPETYEIAARHHPAWDRLSQGVHRLMARNVTIALGEDLTDHADMIICWTPGARLIGGTAQAMKVGFSYDIPVFNLADLADQARLDAFVAKCHTA
jgi:hypothetical protein